MEGADEILAAGVVDTGLAADRGVDLREQRRGNLRVGNAALIAGGRETRDVAHHASAECHHGRIAVEFLPHQRVEHPSRRLQGLVLLAVRKDAFGDVALPQIAAQFREVEARDGGVGDDHEVSPGNPSLEKRRDRRAIPSRS